MTSIRPRPAWSDGDVEAFRDLAHSFLAKECAPNEERWNEAELYRLKGEYLLAQASPNAQEAGTYFQQALDLARQQRAKLFELRTAMSLSRLWHQQGQRAPARQLLAEVYGWFTEGFDTADLQEARALLDQLS